MRRALLFLVLAACSGNVTPPPQHAQGTISDDLCGKLGAARVSVLDGAAVDTVEGRFTLPVDGPATFQVEASGHVTTLSVEREPGDDLELFSVPTELLALALPIASAEAMADRGQVVLAFVDEGSLPIEGVTVTLVKEGATNGPQPRYPSLVSGVFTLDSSLGSTQPSSGLVGFLNVPQGTYVLHAMRDGRTFPSPRVQVRSGAVTFDVIRGDGSGGTQPIVVEGTVKTTFAPAVLLSGLNVTLEADGQAPMTTSTAADGTYRFELPFMRREYDVTVEGDGFGPVRTQRLCAMPAQRARDFAVKEHAGELAPFLEALGSAPLDPAAGFVTVDLYGKTAQSGADGATVALDPPSGIAWYGRPKARDACASTSCTVSSDCGSGTRCENGECVLGDAGPLCSRCDSAFQCPTGYVGRNYVPVSTSGPAVTGGFACYCLPEQPCLTGAAQCPAQTFCNYAEATMPSGRSQRIFEVCEPWSPGANVTFSWSWGLAAPRLSNVAPGEYAVKVSAADRTFGRAPRVRVSAGVVVKVSTAER